MPVPPKYPILITCIECNKQFYYKPKSDCIFSHGVCMKCKMKTFLSKLLKGKM